MTKVTFENVGRNKLTWSVELREVSESALYRAIKKRRALASNDIYCRSDDGVNGVIIAGFRQVGTFHIHEPVQS